MIALDAAQSIDQSLGLATAIKDAIKLEYMAQQSYQYVAKQLGASKKIIAYLLLK